MLKMGHFLGLAIFGCIDNQLVEQEACLASGGGVNT
jgi:hypothetical protein